MTKDWQEKHMYLISILKAGNSYSVYNGDKLLISGTFEKYEKGRYFFKNNNELFKINLHKAIKPRIVENSHCDKTALCEVKNDG
ncbi:hypothetical protein FACS1894187_10660 [Synergistales bacterium]|nr:hypothetical protein FACS1894187_10660 [Synergistales bacterium]